MNSNLPQESDRGAQPVFAVSQRFALDSKSHRKEAQTRESDHE